LGDEGSGYVLGRKALMAAAKEYDGRGTATLITKLLKEKFKINSAEELIAEIYHKKFDAASAAPLLLEAAELNDHVALKIIDEEIEELLEHIKVMAAKIKTHELNVALAGSLLDKDNIYSRRLKEKIKLLPSIILKDPENEPQLERFFWLILPQSETNKEKHNAEKDESGNPWFWCSLYHAEGSYVMMTVSVAFIKKMYQTRCSSFEVCYISWVLNLMSRLLTL
jgi:hypothetical protein